MKSVAIIGAGIAGLTLATRLKGQADVTVMEKSRGYGGRMATRRAESYQFDHGAQYFTARSAEFRQFLLDFFPEGFVRDWQPRTVTLGDEKKVYVRPWFEPHWVGVPGMNEPGRVLAEGLHIGLNTELTKIDSTATGWLLTSSSGEQHGPFDWVVSTAPAPQTRALLPPEFQHHQVLDNVRISACFSLMLGYRNRVDMPFQAAQVKNSSIGWLALDSDKPGRTGGQSLLVHSSNHWADEHLHEPIEQVREQLLTALQRLLPQLPEPDHVDIHRWRYAATTAPAEEEFLLDAQHRLAACGDWCLGNRVEDAFTSADRLAAVLAKRL